MQRHDILIQSAALLLLFACSGAATTDNVTDQSLASDGGTTTGADAGTPCSPATGMCHVTLSARFDASQGFDLASARASIIDTSVPASPVDLVLRINRYLVLSGASDSSLCLVGEGYSQLSQVPADTAGCTWSPVEYFGLLISTVIRRDGRGFWFPRLFDPVRLKDHVSPDADFPAG